MAFWAGKGNPARGRGGFVLQPPRCTGAGCRQDSCAAKTGVRVRARGTRLFPWRCGNVIFSGTWPVRYLIQGMAGENGKHSNLQGCLLKPAVRGKLKISSGMGRNHERPEVLERETSYPGPDPTVTAQLTASISGRPWG